MPNNLCFCLILACPFVEAPPLVWSSFHLVNPTPSAAYTTKTTWAAAHTHNPITLAKLSSSSSFKTNAATVGFSLAPLVNVRLITGHAVAAKATGSNSAAHVHPCAAECRTQNPTHPRTHRAGVGIGIGMRSSADDVDIELVKAVAQAWYAHAGNPRPSRAPADDDGAAGLGARRAGAPRYRPSRFKL
ncbi:uncharacterized protein [Triticum aestivum]|uniref:uncharacterized protein n=1 Tax=Triticum aestivum TaxID=4565 RepID=UPI001D032D61|nr:uncharacterized protein LOC123129612 [Triticum aestivum]